MAFNTDKGRFTITNFSVTPSPMAYGDAFTISITLTNKTGQKLTGFELYADALFRNTVLTVQQTLIEEYGNDVYSPDWSYSSDRDDGSYRFGIYYDDVNPTGWGWQKAISWPNNTARTFTYQARFMSEDSTLHPPKVVNFYRSRDAWDAREDPIAEVDLNTPDLSARLIQISTSGYFNFAWSLSIGYTYGSSGDDTDGVDISTSYAVDPIVISRHWNPAASLSVKRGLANGSASDEGERLLVTAKLSKNEYADASAMFCRLYYEENGTATTSSSYIDLTQSISALLAGVTDDASLVTQTFSNGSNWSFLLVFGDDYETASAPASIALAFANVHMSGASTGGVAFGRFSSSSEGNPKFECAYPATFESSLDMRVGGIDVTDQFTISKTAGKLTISSFKAYKCGPLIFFQLNCSMSGATTPGNSVFEGTIAGPWLPSFHLCGMAGFWSTSIEVFFVDTAGKVTFRAMVANDGPSGSSSWSGVRSFYYFF